MMTLGDYCDLIAGRATLVVEIKSRFDGDRRLAERVVQMLKAYSGPAAAMSFDPWPVGVVRNMAPGDFSRYRRRTALYARGMEFPDTGTETQP